MFSSCQDTFKIANRQRLELFKEVSYGSVVQSLQITHRDLNHVHSTMQKSLFFNLPCFQQLPFEIRITVTSGICLSLQQSQLCSLSSKMIVEPIMNCFHLSALVPVWHLLRKKPKTLSYIQLRDFDYGRFTIYEAKCWFSTGYLTTLEYCHTSAKTIIFNH